MDDGKLTLLDHLEDKDYKSDQSHCCGEGDRCNEVCGSDGCHCKHGGDHKNHYDHPKGEKDGRTK